MTFEPKRTELSSLGEFGLIRHLTGGIGIAHPATLKGIGDDAAVLGYVDPLALVSTDLLVEGIHFDLSYYPLKHLGYKAAAVNISDIAAMNGTPGQMIIGLSVSNRFSVEAVESLYEGLRMACSRYNVDLVGGDTTSSPRGLFISITVIGWAGRDEIVYRSTARQGDLLCVSGDLGGAYMGLLLLEREKKVFVADPSMQPDLEGHDYVLERQLKPEARTDIVEMLRDMKLKPTAMIDISDGLASETLHICQSSSVGCNIYEHKIPIDPSTYALAHEFGIDPTTAAMNGGEDYELLFTISQEDYKKVEGHPDITVIGHMTDAAAGVNLISEAGSSVPIVAQGWDALLKREHHGKQ
jgi:thiamine-monophosphate kinase